MCSPRRVAVLAALVLGVLAAATIALASEADTQSEERAVLRVVKRGQAAILADRPKAVCRLLTRRARRNSLILYGLDTYPDGRHRAKPKTCAKAVEFMIDDSPYRRKLRRGGAYHGTEVVEIGAGRAIVRKRDIEIALVKRKGRWFADSGNFAPFDGSSGY